MSSETSNGDKANIEKMEIEPVKKLEIPAADSEKLSPMDELIRAAIIMNPKVFELPRELNIYSQFPGEDRCKFSFISFSF